MPPGADVPVIDEAARGSAVIDLHRRFLAATQKARSSWVNFGAGSSRQLRAPGLCYGPDVSGCSALRNESRRASDVPPGAFLQFDQCRDAVALHAAAFRISGSSFGINGAVGKSVSCRCLQLRSPDADITGMAGFAGGRTVRSVFTIQPSRRPSGTRHPWREARGCGVGNCFEGQRRHRLQWHGSAMACPMLNRLECSRPSIRNWRCVQPV